MTSTLVHLSDTHFGTEVPQVVRAVEQALLAIKPDIVTISGDLTQRARPRQFAATKAFLDAMPGDIKFVIPGNHDIPLFNLPLRLLDPHGNYTHVFGLREGIWCHGEIGIIGFDATSRWRHTRGKLLGEHIRNQIKRARAQLKPGGLLVAVAHQPLVVAWLEDAKNVLVNNAETARIFSENGVDLVLSGHVHVPLIETTHSAFPDLARPFVLSGAGTAISHRIRPGAPNSFNLIRLDAQAKTIIITVMEYHAGAFTARVKKTFALQPQGWHRIAQEVAA